MVKTKSVRLLALELVAASFVVLFQELTLIRWLPGQVRVLAYFPNLILVSAFLGLGLGCLRAQRKSLLWLWPVSLLAVTAMAYALSGVVFTQNSPSEHLYLLYYDVPREAPVINDVRPPILLFFIVTAFCFLPLGQIVAQRLQEFRMRTASLVGYCWDIVGSLAGIVGFTILGVSGVFPVVWFAVLLVVTGSFFLEERRRLIGFVSVAVLILFLVQNSERADRYSPYYAMRLVPAEAPHAFAVLTNGSFHQVAFDPGGTEPLPPYFEQARTGYNRPYGFLQAPPKRALVLGAGTGNDVAVLLSHGAQHVDAVEIDPVILDFGRRLHPARPYDSPRVDLYTTDARSFLESSHERYDLIVFATLDSMTRLSALSNVRLDNFVYTLECLAAAREHLSSNGGLVMYFAAANTTIAQRLSGMLTQVFGQFPVVIDEYYNLFNCIYMAGPAFEARNGGERRGIARTAAGVGIKGVELPTDDWPFLYLQSRGLGTFYLSVMSLLAAISAGAVLAASPAMRSSISGGTHADWEMFFFGLGFLLLETSAVTRMNLLWGATWLTSAVVFASILATMLLSTVWNQLRPIPYPISSLGVVVSLLAVWMLPVRLLLTVSITTRLVFSVAFVGTPIFFASACFAVLFRDRAQADTAFGWNLLGAVAGGLLELTSMALGMKALLLVALLAYLSALLVWLRRGGMPRAVT